MLAVTLVVWRHWLVTLAALRPRQRLTAGVRPSAVPITVIFNFNELGFNPSPYAAWALVFEIVAAALLVVLLAWDLSSPEGQAMPLDRQDGSIEASNRVESTQ